ncbi:helix-turn-helix transcriptional regulator [Actinobacillus equuli]|uniref:helix-turn-helix transcriptional regulator n=1 Tax=Actinobacillus equuli TaxID=718 RepID=UPI002442AA93|nr:helix-turn-helix transcriptional regulator [Actinobacillus equuli]WGE71592.1 helix-turn-helix transcriptional regulator [Actinobacillus equuli subsp. haemolyticus]WGE75189.1 helix-turn-helix transcriptional regulator [Actinobacillus equuli subsp. haemolyticus]WGE77102.1 helix-turn-helix transcriptional regulator [Actinobacillus equuli subsp. haemolyticus]
MKFEDFKKEAFVNNPALKAEYDRLALRYEIIKQVIRLRNEMKLTQKEFAERTGLTQSAVSRLESGRYNPSLVFLDKLAKGVGKELHIEFR